MSKKEFNTNRADVFARARRLAAAASTSCRDSNGFTLMEIVVATTIFALVVSALMAMFNYTLKINRSGDSLRQATQGMRDLVEFVAKEIRNGQITYGVSGGTTIDPNSFYTASNPCKTPVIDPPIGLQFPVHSTYGNQDNKLAILTPENDYECFYLAEGPGNSDGLLGAPLPVGSPLAGSSAGSLGVTATNPKPSLALQKNTLPLEILTPPNVSVQRVIFMVRPTCDPYASDCVDYSNSYPRMQPFVTILAQFRVTLPTGEQTDIYYQTTVSSNDYNIPH